MSSNFGFRAASYAALIFLLSACGGGGGQGSSSGTQIGPPQSSSDSGVSLSKATLAASVKYSDQPAVGAVRFYLSGPLNGVAYYGIRSTGDSVWNATASFDSDFSGGTLTVNFPTPGSLGDGTYAGTVSLLICTDSECKKQIKGSPASLAVTYTVTGGVPDGRMAITPPQPDGTQAGTFFKATTDDASASTHSYHVHIVDAPPGDLTIHVSRHVSGVVTDLTVGDLVPGAPSVLDSDATITLADPKTMHSGIYADTIQFRACLDDACTKQLRDSPQTFDVRYFVAATPGKEYTSRTIPMPLVASVSLEPHTGKLYAVVPHIHTLPQKTTVNRIDPVSGVVDASLDLDGFSSRIEFSNDGQYAYLCRDNWEVIHQIRVATFQADADRVAVDHAECTSPVIAPGNTLRIAFWSSYGAGLRVIDGNTDRPLQTLPFNSGPLAWGTDADTLYAIESSNGVNSLHTLRVSQTGVASETSAPAALPNDVSLGPDMSFAAGKLFLAGGAILEAATGDTVGTCTLPEPDSGLGVLPDTAANRIFTLYRSSSLYRSYLVTFGITGAATDGLIDLGSPLREMSSAPVRWGTDGIALVLTDELHLINGPLISQQASSSVTTVSLEKSAAVVSVASKRPTLSAPRRTHDDFSIVTF